MKMTVFNGKPLEKLIEVLSSAFGTLYKPTAIRNEATAEAFRIKVIEKAKAESLVEGRQIEVDGLSQISSRIIFEETKRQMNIDKVVNFAREQISLESSVSDVPVNPDWTTRFFNIVQDISDEEMQKLWGRILSGEVKQPNSFSLRTLEILKSMTKTEAEIFNKLSKYALFTDPIAIVPNFINSSNNIMAKYGLRHIDKLILEEAGLISNVATTYTIGKRNEPTLLQHSNGIIRIKNTGDDFRIRFHTIPYTKSGSELLFLTDHECDLPYLNYFATEIKRINESFEIEYMPCFKNEFEKWVPDETKLIKLPSIEPKL